MTNLCKLTDSSDKTIPLIIGHYAKPGKTGKQALPARPSLSSSGSGGLRIHGSNRSRRKRSFLVLD